MNVVLHLSFYSITFYCYIFTFFLVFTLSLLFLLFKPKGDFLELSKKFSKYLILYCCYKSAVILEEPYIYKSYADYGFTNDIISLLLFLYLVSISFFKIMAPDILRIFNYKTSIIISSICGFLSSLLRIHNSLNHLIQSSILHGIQTVLMEYILSDWLFSCSYLDAINSYLIKQNKPPIDFSNTSFKQKHKIVQKITNKFCFYVQCLSSVLLTILISTFSSYTNLIYGTKVIFLFAAGSYIAMIPLVFIIYNDIGNYSLQSAQPLTSFHTIDSVPNNSKSQFTINPGYFIHNPIIYGPLLIHYSKQRKANSPSNFIIVFHLVSLYIACFFSQKIQFFIISPREGLPISEIYAIFHFITIIADLCFNVFCELTDTSTIITIFSFLESICFIPLGFLPLNISLCLISACGVMFSIRISSCAYDTISQYYFPLAIDLVSTVLAGFTMIGTIDFSSAVLGKILCLLSLFSNIFIIFSSLK